MSKNYTTFAAAKVIADYEKRQDTYVVESDAGADEGMAGAADAGIRRGRGDKQAHHHRERDIELPRRMGFR